MNQSKNRLIQKWNHPSSNQQACKIGGNKERQPECVPEEEAAQASHIASSPVRTLHVMHAQTKHTLLVTKRTKSKAKMILNKVLEKTLSNNTAGSATRQPS